MNRRGFFKTFLLLTSSLFLKSRLFSAQSATLSQFFVIPPTLHHLTEESAIVYFRLNQVTPQGILSVKQADRVLQNIPLSPALLRQQILIENLQPATTYACAFEIDGISPPTHDELPWGELQFTTPPYDYPLRVVAIGDSGFGDNTTVQLAKHMAEQNLHFFIHLGDVVYRLNDYDNNHFYNWYRKYFAPFADLLHRVPHYPTLGNHEFDASAVLDDLPSYHWVFPPFTADNYNDLRYWYSFQYNEIQFICLNSQLIYQDVAIRNAQMTWLEKELARTDSLYKVVFFHIAPYTSGAVHPTDGLPIVEQWLEKFEAGNVKLVLSGHAHLYERLYSRGIHYIVAGAGSAVVYQQGQLLLHSQRFCSCPSYPILEFYPDKIRVQAYDVNGQIIDAAEFAV